MKSIFLALIIFLSIAAFYGVIPATDLVISYGIIAVAPLVIIFLRKNLVNTLLIWFFFLLFQGIGKINLPLLPDLSPERIIWIIIAVSLFLDMIFKKRKIFTGDFKMEIAMILLIIYILFSKMFAGTFFKEDHGIQLSYLLNGYAIPFSLFFFGKNLINDEKKVRQVFLFFCIVGLYLGLTGIFEHFRLDYLVFPSYIMRQGLGLHFGQSRGPFLNANVNGLTIGLIIFTSIYLYQADKRKWVKRLIILSVFSMLITLLFTYNRASWIGFFIASLFIPVFFRTYRLAYIAGLLIICVAGLIMIGSSQEKAYVERFTKAEDIKKFDTGGKLLHRFKSSTSFDTRLEIVKTAGKMFLDKPILGFGYGTFKRESVKYFSGEMTAMWDPSKRGISVHNTIMQLLVELGLAGFSVFLYILLYPLHIARELYRVLPPEEVLIRNLAVIVFLCFILYFILMQGMVFHYFMFPNAIYYLIIGIMSGLYQRYQTGAFRIQEIDEKSLISEC